jgi:hypothetical protein
MQRSVHLLVSCYTDGLTIASIYFTATANKCFITTISTCFSHRDFDFLFKSSITSSTSSKAPHYFDLLEAPKFRLTSRHQTASTCFKHQILDVLQGTDIKPSTCSKKTSIKSSTSSRESVSNSNSSKDLKENLNLFPKHTTSIYSIQTTF